MKTAKLITLLAALLCAAVGVQGQWVRLGMDHGGVVEDLQLVVGNEDVVWSADMGNAFFRATWQGGSGNPWSPWQEYLPGKKGFGVDAIKVGDTEHVYLATGGMGPWYASSTTGSFPEVWDRPILPSSFPRVWKHSALQDVAFYWPDEGTPSAPQTQFYILGNAGGFNNGVYRWYIQPEPLGFTRVDEDLPSDDPHNYSHFYRDVNDKNVLYVTSPDGIYKLSGPYGRETFVKLPAGTRLQDLPIARPPKNLPPLPVSH